MKFIDCDCGETLKAANDDDLASEVQAHAEQSHPEMGMSEEDARRLVADRAYEAADS